MTPIRSALIAGVVSLAGAPHAIRIEAPLTGWVPPAQDAGYFVARRGNTESSIMAWGMNGGAGEVQVYPSSPVGFWALTDMSRDSVRTRELWTGMDVPTIRWSPVDFGPRPKPDRVLDPGTKLYWSADPDVTAASAVSEPTSSVKP